MAPRELDDGDLREPIRRYLQELFHQPVEKTAIKAIIVNPPFHRQNRKRIEVGQFADELEPGQPAEKVMAIFESKSFLVCTMSRGAGIGLPYIFPRETVNKVEEE